MSDENIPRLKELAIRGKKYREVEEYDYLGESLELSIGPLEDETLLPILALLEEKFGVEDIEEAEEEIEKAQEGVDGSKVDAEFVAIMAEAAFNGIDTSENDAEGLSDEELRQVLGIGDEDEENIGLVGGLTLDIAQDILSISSDDEMAENFRR